MKQIFIQLLIFSIWGTSHINIFSQIEYDYLGQIPPGDTPVVFALGKVSVEGKNSHALAVSPDGKMIIFSRYPDGTSYIISRENNKWTEPVQSFFYGKEVSFSPEGNRIYYYTGGDIYYVEKKKQYGVRQ